VNTGLVVEANPDRPVQPGLSGRPGGTKFGIIWLVVAVGGAVSIWISPSYELKRLLIPLGIMVLYAWYGYWHASRIRNNPPMRAARISLLADSIYFRLCSRIRG
jgi:hypothetical protein